jgi:hypothetical protein
MRSNRSRSRKLSWIIDTDFERKGGSGTTGGAAHGPASKTFTTAELASRYSHALYKTALADSSFIPLPCHLLERGNLSEEALLAVQGLKHFGAWYDIRNDAACLDFRTLTDRRCPAIAACPDADEIFKHG